MENLLSTQQIKQLTFTDYIRIESPDQYISSKTIKTKHDNNNPTQYNYNKGLVRGDLYKI